MTDAPDAMFLFPSRLVIFDNVRHTILIVAHGSVHAGEDRAPPTRGRSRPSRKFGKSSACRWKDPKSPTGTTVGRKPAFEMPRGAFLDAVRKAKEHIRNGDIIQVVLSNRATVRTRRTPAEVYRVLRALNPSPYMYLLRMGDLSIVGSSPEILVRLEGTRSSSGRSPGRAPGAPPLGGPPAGGGAAVGSEGASRST